MSRSYREPWHTEGYGGNNRKLQKRIANVKVRKCAEIANGMAYKKIYCSWNICDWKFPGEDTKKGRSK